MAAYMIVLAKIEDRARFLEEYAKPAAALVAQYGGEYVMRGPGVETLEGAANYDGQSAVISKWPDKDTIKKFWSSPEYQVLKDARSKVSTVNVMIVEAPE